MTALRQPTYSNVAWSFESPNCFFHYYEHATRDPGGNPLIIYLHGGGGKSNDPRILTHAGTRPQCVVFETLMDYVSSTDLHFDFIGLSVDQWATLKAHPQSNQGQSWKTGGAPDPDDGSVSTPPTYPNASFPTGKDTVGAVNVNEATWKLQVPYSIKRAGSDQAVNAVKRAIIAIKSRSTVYGGEFSFNPDKVFLMGTSYGGWLAMTCQAQPPLVVPKHMAFSGYEWFPMQPGVTSQVRGIINWYGHPDVRRGGPQVLAKGGTVNDEPLPDVVSEAFHSRLHSKHDPLAQRKKLFSAQYFMESGNSKWIPPIIHFMFGDPVNTYPLPAPYHQSDLGLDAVRYGGRDASRAVEGDLSPAYRSHEVYPTASASFSATGGEGPLMKRRILDWAKRCLSD